MLAFKDRILLAEDDFLSALASGEDAVVAFNERWEALVAEADQLMESSGLDKEASGLLHTVAFRIAMLADTSAEMLESSDSITSDLLSQIEDLVSQMTLEDGLSTDTPSHRLSLPSSRSPSLSAPPSINEQCSGRKRRRLSDEIPVQAKRKRTSPPTISLQPSQRHDIHASTRKRKRCVSEVDSPAPVGPTKRLYAGPRLHAVSDSFPTLRLFSSTPTSRPSPPGTSLKVSGWLDVHPLAVPSSTQCVPERTQCHPSDTFNADSCFASPLEPSSLDAFLTSLVEFDVSPSFDFSAALAESEHTSCLSPSSSSVSSRSSPTPSPLATPPSSPRMDIVALNIPAPGCQPNLPPPEADCWFTCSTSHFDDFSTFLPSDFNSDGGWKTFLDLDRSVWIVPPSDVPLEPYQASLENLNILQTSMVSSV